MANPGMRHAFKSAKSDPADTSLVGATKWNDRHYFLEDDGTTAAGATGDLPYRGTAGLVTLLSGAQGLLSSAGSGNVPAWTMSPSITNLTLASAGILAWSTDVNVIRTAADSIAQRRSTNTQLMEIGPSGTGLMLAGSSGSASVRSGGAIPLNLGVNTGVNWQINTSGHLLALGAFDIGDGAGNSPINVYVESAFRTIDSGALVFGSRSLLKSSADGNFVLLNQAENSFGRLQFGGTTSSFPAIKRNSAALQVRLADDSAYAVLQALSVQFGTGGSVITDAADGKANLTNAAATAGVGLDVTTDGTLKIRNRAHGADGQLSAASVRGNAVAFASLPGTAVEGMVVAVTDSNTNTWGATIAGGGANHVLAYYNGTNWTVAGK